MINFVNARKHYILALAILFVVVSLSGTTYSLFLKSDTTNTFNYTTGLLDLQFTEDSPITLSSAFPKIDSEGMKQEPYTLTLKNTGTLTYLFNLKMLSSTVDNVIDSKYIKVQVNNYLPETLYENNHEIVKNMIIYPGEEIQFKIRIWLDITTPNAELGKTFTAKVAATGNSIYKTLDSSGANHPKMISDMIPIYYDETSNIKIADGSNTIETYNWYNYDKQMWANSVTVSSANRSTYQSASVGTEIPMDDILTMEVWIPRYKYKVWNKDKVVGTDSYNAQTTGIDIVFEDGTSTTGTIICNNYSYSAPASTAGSPNETCTGSNGDYYTHPAFTFGDKQVKGFWIGKYELSSETPTITDGGGSSTTLTPRILPNVISWRNNKLSNFSTVIQNMQVSSNIYGLSTDKSTTDSHMLTNMEWGAVAYLTNSNYGRCSNGTCTEVTINNCSTYITGIGADTVSASSSSTTCTTDANKYNGAKGVLASTTGNVYGVYDMSGGAYEYVMGNMSSTADTYTFHSYSAGFASSWYNDYAYFVSANKTPWFHRGCNYYVTDVGAGAFTFYGIYGYAHSTAGFRSVVSFVGA